MDMTRHALALVQRGAVAEAFDLLSEGVSRGDAQAAFLLAQWRMAGDLIRRDLGEARRLFGVAADWGFKQAEAPYTALLANGAGGTGRRWNDAIRRLRSAETPECRRQLELLEAMDIDEQGNPRSSARTEAILSSPKVWRLPRFLTKDECDYLCALATPILQPSVVVHPRSGALVLDPVRKSSAAAFPFIRENPVLHAINRRIANATATSYEQGEPLQVLCYEPGQEYKTHSDALPNELNQRVLTFLVYLTNDYAGGETYFPEVDWSFKGAIGEALFFRNVDSQGRPDASAIHAGRPVERGRKLIVSKWIREAPLDLGGPPGRPF